MTEKPEKYQYMLQNLLVKAQQVLNLRLTLLILHLSKHHIQIPVVNISRQFYRKSKVLEGLYQMQFIALCL